MQRWVWMHVNKMDELLPVFLDVAVERAVTLGVHTAVAERIIDSLSAFSSANIRGKLLARLRIVRLSSLLCSHWSPVLTSNTSVQRLSRMSAQRSEQLTQSTRQRDRP